MSSHARHLAAVAAAMAVIPAVAVPAQSAVAAPNGASSSTARSAASAPAPAPLRWTRCGGGLQCATLEVPLDYSDPSAGTTEISIARRPADRQDTKVGVLFTNPGGPGAAGSGSVSGFASVLGRTVRQKFDIIGVDPRGTGGSDLAECQAEAGEEPPQTSTFAFPLTPEEIAAQLKVDAYVQKACATGGSKILGHMTTADDARDMDRVRAALGQDKINYYGVSYGSFLGTTYASMFPDRVRAVAVDGVLDPVAWSTGSTATATATPMTTRIKSHIGSYEALMSAIAECERNGPGFCDEDESVRADWAELASLREKPIDLGGGFLITYDLVVAIVTSNLYDPEGVPDVLQFIHEIAEYQRDPAGAVQQAGSQQQVHTSLRRIYGKLKARDAANRKNRIAYDPPAPADAEPAPAYYVAFQGVVCSDAVQPNDPQAWVKAAKASDAVAPGFGPLWTWSSSLCAGWPVKSTGAYRGPYDVTPANGMLIMNTLHDPATPYTGAKALRRLQPTSRLVTVPGWGHGVLDSSGCASWLRTKYLTTGQLPAKDTTCAPDHALFSSLD